MKKTFSIILTTLLVLALCIGCGAKSEMVSFNPAGISSDSLAVYSDMSNIYGINTEQEIAFDMEPLAAESSTDGGLGVQIEIPQGRKIILNAEVRMETLEFDTTIRGLSEAIQQNGGYVSNSSQSGSGEGNSRRDYYITARIPTDNYNNFLTDTAETGTIIYKQESSTDVTSQYIDVEARLLTLKMERDRLLTLLADADDIESLIIIEERLSDVQYEIERFEIEKRTFDDLISYSTVNISVREVKIITEINDGFFPRLVDSISGSWRNFVSDLQNFLFGFIYALPTLIIWAAIIFGLVIFIKKMRKKRKERLANLKSTISNDKNSVSKPTKEDIE